jgi:Tfp pilus assembly protein PilF
MRGRRIAVALACVVALGVVTGAQSRGKSKAEGRVLDEQGEPLPDAIVVAVMEGYDTPFQQTKTNRRGQWSIDNLAAGNWKFYFGGVDGLEEKAVDVPVASTGTVKLPDVTLGKPFDHHAYLNGELQRAAEFMQTRQPGEARTVYEGILAKYPDVDPEFRGQLHGAIAQSYAAQNQPKEAVNHLRKAVELDSDNTDIRLVLGELLLQIGEQAEAEKVLLAVDMSKVQDPFPFMNMVITKINDEKSDEALDLIGRLMAQFPNESRLYYYRGRAHLASKDYPAARADLEKFVDSAPADASELADAKKILEQLKDVQ